MSDLFESNANVMIGNVDFIELQLSVEKSKYLQDNWFPISSSSKNKQPDCPQCTRKYKQFLVGDKKIQPNQAKCCVCGFNFKIYKQCGYKLSAYYKQSKDAIPRHLHKKIQFNEKCKFYPKEQAMVKEFKEILKQKDCLEHKCEKIEKRKSCKKCKNKTQCRKWKIMVFVLDYYQQFCDEQEYEPKAIAKDSSGEPDFDLQGIEEDEDIDIQEEEEKKYNKQESKSQQSKLSLKKFGATSEPLILDNSSSIVPRPQAFKWPSINESKIIDQEDDDNDDNDDDDKEDLAESALSFSRVSRASSDPFAYNHHPFGYNRTLSEENGIINDELDIYGRIVEDDIDPEQDNEQKYEDWMNEESIDDEDGMIQQRSTEIFYDPNDKSDNNNKSSKRTLHQSLEYRKNKEYKTPHGICVGIDRIIDIFSIYDCRWYTAKIVSIEQNNELVTVQKLQVKARNNKEEIINFSEEWYRIQLRGSRCNETFHKKYDPQIGTHALYVTKYGKQHQDIGKAYYNIAKSNNIAESPILIKGWMSKKGYFNNKNRYVSRFFVLRNDKKLYYYKNEKENVEQYSGFIDLSHIQQLCKNPKEKTYSFMMKTPYQNKRHRIWYLKCKSAEILTDWITVLFTFYKNKPPPQPIIVPLYVPFERNNQIDDNQIGGLSPIQSGVTVRNNTFHSIDLIGIDNKYALDKKQRSRSEDLVGLSHHDGRILNGRILKTRSVSDDMKRCLNDTPIKQGTMQKKSAGIIARWQERFFALSFNDKKLYYFEDETKFHYLKYVDLRAIYEIKNGPNQGNKKYCQFRLIEEKREWEFRVKTERERIEWLEKIRDVWSGLKLTLTRLVNVLNKATKIDAFKDLFVHRGYTLVNLLDDHIHVMRHHSWHDYKDIDNCKPCDHKTCKSLKRHKRDRVKDNFKSKEYCKMNFYTLNHDEIRLQDIFDNIHCFMYHKDQVFNNDQDEKQQDEKKYDFQPKRIRLARINDNENKGKHDDDDDAEEDEEEDYYAKQERLSSRRRDDYKDDGQRPKLIKKKNKKNNDNEEKGRWDTNLNKSKCKLYDDPLYNFEKYDCKFDEMPGEYSIGHFMNYPRQKPTFSCLKDELLALGITIEIWEIELRKAKEILQTKEADSQTINANNDHYNLRFGDHISIGHILAMIFYCNYGSLCYGFRKSFRGENIDDNEKEIEQQHYSKYYWWGRFLYEAVEFYGCKMDNIVYLGVDSRKLMRSPCADFSQPTSTSDQFLIAKNFAKSEDQAGMILELDSMFIKHSVRNETRYMFTPWISNYGNEREYLFFGYNNTILIRCIYIWTDKENGGQRFWRRLRFEMNALNYFAKLSMGYSGVKEYNVKFGKEKNLKLGRKDTQHFLAKLIEFELDENKTISDIQSDHLRFIHRMFHHFLFTKKGDLVQKSSDNLLDIDFRGIRRERIICKKAKNSNTKSLGEYLFENPNDDPSKWIISKSLISNLYPNGKRYIDQDGKQQEIKAITNKRVRGHIYGYAQRMSSNDDDDNDNDNKEEEKSNATSNDDNTIGVKEWLENVVQLPEYVQNFIGQGYDDMDVIKEYINNEKLIMIGINLMGHRDKILMHIKRLKK